MESQEKSQGSRQRFRSNRISQWGIRIFLVGFVLAWLSLMAFAWTDANATESLPEPERRGSSDEYNFSWLDPDKKIYVLQNRKYLKGGRPLLSVMGTLGLSNPFKNSYGVDPRFAYYMNETFGFEVFYTNTTNSDSSALTAIKAIQNPSIAPATREIQTQLGAMLHYVPWYAKINVFNQILYFDWYFGAGLGSIRANATTSGATSSAVSAIQNLLGVYLSTGHLYHLSEHWIFRVDLTGAFYNAPVNGTGGNSVWYSNFNFAAGIGWRM